MALMSSAAERYLALKPRDTADILDQSIQLYRRNFKLLFGIVALIALPTAAIQLVASLFWSLLFPAETFLPPDREFQNIPELLRVFGAFQNPLSGLLVFINLIAGLFSTCALYAATIGLLRGETITIGQSYKLGSNRVAHYALGASLYWLVFYVVLIGGAALSLIGSADFRNDSVFWAAGAAALLIGLLLLIITAFAAVSGPAIVNERLNAIAGLRRSMQLVRRRVRPTLLLTLGKLILISACQGIPAAIAGFLYALAPWPVASAVVYRVTSDLTTAVLAPLGIIIATVLHVDLRVRFEGVDLLLTAQEIRKAAQAERARAEAMSPATLGGAAK
jgi:hypothetical protein